MPFEPVPKTLSLLQVAVVLTAAVVVLMTAALVCSFFGGYVIADVLVIPVAICFGFWLFVVIQMARSDRYGGLVRSIAWSTWAGMWPLLWTLLFGLLFVGVFILLDQLNSAAGSIIVYFLGLFSIVTLCGSEALAYVRRRRVAVILSYVEKAVRLNFPMPEMIEAAAQSETGTTRRKLIRLSDYLDRGEPLSEALSRAIPEASDGIIRATEVADRMGRLPEVLRQLARNRTVRPGGQQSGSVYLGYPLILFIVVATFCVFVVPKFQHISFSFSLSTAWPLRVLLYLAGGGGSSAYILFVAALAIFPLGFAMSRILPVRAGRDSLLAVAIDQLAWRIPLLHGYLRDKGLAEIFNLAGAAVESGRPFDDVLTDAADAQGNAVLRRRLLKWAKLVREGTSIDQAARNVRMPDLVVGMLATARDADGLAQILSFLERHYQYRNARTRAIVSALYVPIIVGIMGVLVGLVGLALFVPLTQMIDHLSMKAGGF